MGRLLRLAEASPFAWDRVGERVNPWMLEEAAGALAGLRLILGMDDSTAQTRSRIVDRPSMAAHVLRGTPFLAGMADGLVAASASNQSLATELVLRRPSDAYRLGVLAGATALSRYLDRQTTRLDNAADVAVLQIAQGLRNDFDVKEYVARDRTKLLTMAAKARRDEDSRADITDAAVEEWTEQQTGTDNTAGQFLEFLNRHTREEGEDEGLNTSGLMFRPGIDVREADASPFAQKLLEVLPPHARNLPMHDLYAEGVRRSLAFVAFSVNSEA